MQDEQGREYWWMAGSRVGFKDIPCADDAAVMQGRMGECRSDTSTGPPTRCAEWFNLRDVF